VNGETPWDDPDHDVLADIRATARQAEDDYDQLLRLPPFIATLPCGCLAGSDTPVGTYHALAKLIRAHECPFTTRKVTPGS
jgi:hypothetical protein